MAFEKNDFWAVAGIVVAIALAAIGFAVADQYRQEDKDVKQRESQPELAYVEGSFGIENGYSILRLENKSPVATAVITSISFIVYDPATLARIERKHARPTEPVATKMDIVDDVNFIHGDWCGDYYEFRMQPKNHIPPSSVNGFRFAIVNPAWAGQEFTGELSITYTGNNSRLVLSPVTIRGRKSR